MRRAKDYYQLVFYVLCGFGLLDDAEERPWKGLVAISVLECWVLVAVAAWLQAVAGVSWLRDLPRSAAAAIIFASLVLNFWGLLHRDRWKVFAGAFERLAADEQRRWIRTAWGIIVVVAGGSLMSIVLLRPEAG